MMRRRVLRHPLRRSSAGLRDCAVAHERLESRGGVRVIYAGGHEATHVSRRVALARQLHEHIDDVGRERRLGAVDGQPLRARLQERHAAVARGGAATKADTAGDSSVVTVGAPPWSPRLSTSCVTLSTH
jgi:hypothetical protein